MDGLNINVFYGDIRPKNDVIKAMQGCDGVRNILEVAKELKVKKVVVTASTAGIGIPDDKNSPLNEESPFDFKRYQKVMYMYSKYLTIKTCEEFARQGLNVSIISPTTIYGAGDVSMHIGKVVKKIKEEKMKYAPPGGNAVVSIEDTITAHLLIMEKGEKGENYIIANEFIPYIEMFNKIAFMLKSKKIKKTLPTWILPPCNIGFGLMENILFTFGKKPLLSPSSINFSFKHRYFDSSKIRHKLGWKPQVSFEETMKRAIEFYEKHNMI
ncbi:NAD-dependent epimerase/dehydratase family protein [Candidatus Woesearchaeota archaeon]|nr:NAD-dependent epimerase/dehydratase family protein [Candidatus Woesearchaeota archaeon]